VALAIPNCLGILGPFVLDDRDEFIRWPLLWLLYWRVLGVELQLRV